jgi:putative spermidine/putrescine transport system substrate-binding protein
VTFRRVPVTLQVRDFAEGQLRGPNQPVLVAAGPGCRSGQARPGAIVVSEEEVAHALGEVEFDFTQSPSGAAPNIASGLVPPTSRAFAFDANLIGDFNYVAIPFNAPNKAAALVTANLILRPDLQAAQVQPDNGFCCGWGIAVDRVTDAGYLAAIEEAMANLGNASADPARLSGALVADIAAEYQTRIEADWQAFVLRGEPMPAN